MSSTPIRIMLADNHTLVRSAWRILLGNNPRFEVIGDYDNDHSVIRYVSELHPDIILIDLNISPLNGFSLAERILQVAPTVKIIGISISNQYQFATRMIELGAKGYLTKTSPLEEIMHGIDEVSRGESYLCREVLNNMPPEERAKF